MILIGFFRGFFNSFYYFKNRVFFFCVKVVDLEKNIFFKDWNFGFVVLRIIYNLFFMSLLGSLILFGNYICF